MGICGELDSVKSNDATALRRGVSRSLLEERRSFPDATALRRGVSRSLLEERRSFPDATALRRGVSRLLLSVNKFALAASANLHGTRPWHQEESEK
jgi:hypothetical protein